MRSRLALKSLTRIALIPLLVWVLLLLPAGTYDFWQVYVYFGLMMMLATAATIYFLVKNPEALRQRMASREQEPAQKRIMAVMAVCVIAIYIVPGLDRRFAWSQVPDVVVLGADALAVIGYLVMLYVTNYNVFAARTIKVDSGQKLIDSGIYSVIRHPMYVGAILLYAATPIALASYWALLPVPVAIAMLVLRIRNEENVLRRELEGYEEYCRRVRWRLLPGAW